MSNTPPVYPEDKKAQNGELNAGVESGLDSDNDSSLGVITALVAKGKMPLYRIFPTSQKLQNVYVNEIERYANECTAA